MVLALGNGFPPQLFSDPTTKSNPATVSKITNIQVDAFGVVTVTVSGIGHGIPVGGDGANVYISNVENGNFFFNGYNGAHIVVKRVSATVFTYTALAAIGIGPSAIGTVTVTTIPLISTFTT